MTRTDRTALALLLLAAALHLPIKAWAAAIVSGSLSWAADHTALVLGTTAVLLLLRTAPTIAGRAISALAGTTAARILTGHTA